MRRLSPAEIEAYDLVDPDLAETVRVQTVPLLAPGVSAMTLGRHVLMRRDDDHDGGSELLAHELVHVRQFAEIGWTRFVRRYLVDYARGLRLHRRHRPAYLAIPMEAEARAEAADWRLRRLRPAAGKTESRS